MQDAMGKLKAEYPFVFELRDKLAMDIATMEGQVREDLDRMTALDRPRDALNERWQRFYLETSAMRAHLEHINKQIANLMAFEQPVFHITEPETRP